MGQSPSSGVAPAMCLPVTVSIVHGAMSPDQAACGMGEATIENRCPSCGVPRREGWVECPRCGLIYEKYREHAPAPEPGPVTPGRESPVLDYLLELKPGTSDASAYGKALVLFGLFVWSWWFIIDPLGSGYPIRSFMHLVDLPFHEAGHVLFSPFGSFMTSLGGSLLQVLMPLACACVLLFRTRDPLGAAAALWWTGQSLIDLAPYIDDARTLGLTLLGGNTGATAPYGFHDWQYILTEAHLLSKDHLIAGLASGLGAFLMLSAFAWSGAVLTRRARSRGPGTVRRR